MNLKHMFLIPGAIPALRPARLALGQRGGREGRHGRVVGDRQRQGSVTLLEADELHLRAGRNLALHPAAGENNYGIHVNENICKWQP